MNNLTNSSPHARSIYAYYLQVPKGITLTLLRAEGHLPLLSQCIFGWLRTKLSWGPLYPTLFHQQGLIGKWIFKVISKGQFTLFIPSPSRHVTVHIKRVCPTPSPAPRGTHFHSSVVVLGITQKSARWLTRILYRWTDLLSTPIHAVCSLLCPWPMLLKDSFVWRLSKAFWTPRYVRLTGDKIVLVYLYAMK